MLFKLLLLLFFRIILNQAVKFGAVVISNDNFRDLYVESAAFREVIETR